MFRLENSSNFILLVFFLLVGFASALGQKAPADFTEIPGLDAWCSAPAEFTTAENTNTLQNICTKSALTYSKWFRFTATTSVAEIQLTMGGEDGTLQFPYLSLWSEDLVSLECKAYADVQDPLVIIYNQLAPGKSYWISVHNHQHSKYVGTFTLCVNDKLSYDFAEGAINVPHQGKWCSEPGGFTTVGATPDNKKASCMKSGPNFNRWFAFTATTNSVEATVVKSGKEGNFEFPYLALWDENFKELGCAQYTNEQTPIAVKSKALVKGKRYYLSVDHGYNQKYLGSFTLCIDNGEPISTRAKFSTISGQLFYINNTTAKGTISLLDGSGKSLRKTDTDAEGAFRFTNVATDEEFLIRIEEDDPAMQVSIYQTDETGNVVRRGERKSGNVYRLVKPLSDFGLVPILHPREYDVIIEETQQGMIGRVVAKSDPSRALTGIKVSLYESSEKQVGTTITDAQGRFNFGKLPGDKAYMVKMGTTPEDGLVEMLMLNDKHEVVSSSSLSNRDANGFYRFVKLPPIAVELFTMEAEDAAFEIPADLSSVRTGSVFRLKVPFNTGDATLTGKQADLDELVAAMKANTAVKIAIEGHTDNTGTDSENQQLSVLRAQRVAEYLTAKGVDKSRLTTSGKGSSEPIASNSSEIGRQANRRVEFKVISK